jgi:hypothetical protein
MGGGGNGRRREAEKTPPPRFRAPKPGSGSAIYPTGHGRLDWTRSIANRDQPCLVPSFS